QHRRNPRQTKDHDAMDSPEDKPSWFATVVCGHRRKTPAAPPPRRRPASTVKRLRFGRHRGVPLVEAPLGYLGWLLSQPWLWDETREEVADEVQCRQQEAERRRAALASDLPTATPRTVCGLDLDEVEAGLFEQAQNAGELLITPDMPCSSPVPEAW